MLVAAYCLDHDAMLETRLKERPAHLEFLRSFGSRLKLAGPLMTDDGEKPLGSLVILEADSLDDAAELLAGDPYKAAGLFRSVELRPWRGVMGDMWEKV